MVFVKKTKVFRKKRPVYKPKPKARFNVTNMVRKELMKNVEKKKCNYINSSTDMAFGQVSGNTYAFHSEEITPPISQGAGAGSRTGQEVKIVSAYMTLQLRQMSACTHPVKCVFYVYSPRGYYTDTPILSTTSLWNPNTFIGTGSQIYDTGSEMNIDQMANFKILRKFTVYIKPDQFSGQQMPVSKSIGFKFKKPLSLKWYSSGTTTTCEGRIMLAGFCSAGNSSLGTASTLTNVPITAINTGVLINYNIRYYYTDM